MFKKILAFFMTRLGLSMLINLIVGISITAFLGYNAFFTFALGVILGCVQSLISIEFETRNKD